ncbi:RNA-directed DNA polymerase from mobile element jockey [Elysia marginata]|uniref:RNA-directed DNA polymerase from mobile element jockey n=1 Tax=Elysia marginata TaxID=1093978 RepID=A0AAV4J1U5_9GAST|nr:RNA-directed DNA polymerase from mobile element jockey [Elysia marginata]
MLQQLGSTGKLFLLNIINQSWKQGRTPRAWKNAHVVPILKKDKDPKELKSYRPISLTSCTGKVAERTVNRRLYWLLENRGLLCEEQSGFRSASRTEDQLFTIYQKI